MKRILSSLLVLIFAYTSSYAQPFWKPANPDSVIIGVNKAGVIQRVYITDLTNTKVANTKYATDSTANRTLVDSKEPVQSGTGYLKKAGTTPSYVAKIPAADLTDTAYLTNTVLDAAYGFRAADSLRVASGRLVYKDMFVYDDFNRPNTTTGIGNALSGGTYDLKGAGLNLGNPPLSKITSRRWVSHVDGVANQTTYAIQALNETAQNVGASWKWVTGNGGVDEAVMIFIAGQLGGDNIVYNAAHIRVTRFNIAFDFFKNGSSAGLTTKVITLPATIPQDREISADFTFVGKACYYSVAGYSGKVVDSLFEQQIGSYVTFEPFYNSANGVNELSVGAVWSKRVSGIPTDGLYVSSGLRRRLTGTTTETNLFQTNIKANSLGNNGYLKVEFQITDTLVSPNVAFAVRLGGILIGYASIGGTAGYQCITRYSNRNSQILGISPHPGNNFNGYGSAIPYTYGAGGTGAGFSEEEINTGIDNLLSISAILTSGSDIVGLESVQVYTYQ